MRKRSKRVEIYFTEEELDLLTQKVKKSGFPREVYCRTALLGKEVKEAPPVDYFTLISEVRRTGSNINQVLRKANSIGLIDVPLLRKALEENHATEDMLWQAFQSG